MRPHSAIPREQITGLVLAGGRGSRMGGVDKGLQTLRGRPLVLHALERLQPQVGALLVNANRHAETYAGLAAGFGARVAADPLEDFPGPLAGMLAGLDAAATPWVATVPCDTPRFPPDLVERLAAAAAGRGAPAALAASLQPDGRRQPEPVFALLHRSLAAPLREALAGGERKIDRWMAAHGAVVVDFTDAQAFRNANTPEELRSLEARLGGTDG